MFRFLNNKNNNILYYAGEGNNREQHKKKTLNSGNFIWLPTTEIELYKSQIQQINGNHIDKLKK